MKKTESQYLSLHISNMQSCSHIVFGYIRNFEIFGKIKNSFEELLNVFLIKLQNLVK